MNERARILNNRAFLDAEIAHAVGCHGDALVDPQIVEDAFPDDKGVDENELKRWATERGLAAIHTKRFIRFVPVNN